MFSMNKKGLSDVVATVFLILSAMFAVSLVGYALLGFVGASLSPERFSCVEEQISPTMTISSAIYNSNTNEVEVTVQRRLQSPTPVSSIEFNLISQSQSSNYACADQCGNCILVGPGMSEVYYFPVEGEIPEQIILSVSGCSLETKRIVV
jgi:hypothetical protein